MMSASKLPGPTPLSPDEEASRAFDHAPWAVTELSGEAHIVRYANSAFCRLIHKSRDELVGRSFDDLLPPADKCLALLERVFRTGAVASYTAEDSAAPLPLLFSYHLWPVVSDGRTAGVMVQVSETGPFHETRQEICQALILRAIHQDALIEAAESVTTQLQTDVSTDALTEIPNRRFFDEFATIEFSRVMRFGKPASILMMDLDNFKRINDGYGHFAGDEVLRQVATVGSTILRASDLFARYGGEEFVCLLPGTDEAGARVAAEKLRLEIEQLAVVVGQKTISVTACIGVGAVSQGDSSIVDAMRRADKAMYLAKASGKNCVR